MSITLYSETWLRIFFGWFGFIGYKTVKILSLFFSVADPDSVSGIRCLFDPWNRDPGWVESQHPDPGSGMNNPDHIF
jgi:hypothetical protein